MSQHFELSDAPITWVMAGDSITQGVLHTYGARSWVEYFYDTFLIDHEAYWVKHFGNYDPIAWMDDSIHPNAVGHAQMAQLTIQRLGLGTLEKVKDLVT